MQALGTNAPGGPAAPPPALLAAPHAAHGWRVDLIALITEGDRERQGAAIARELERSELIAGPVGWRHTPGAFPDLDDPRTITIETTIIACSAREAQERLDVAMYVALSTLTFAHPREVEPPMLTATRVHGAPA